MKYTFLKESNLQETDLFFALLINFRPIKNLLLSDLDCGGCQSLYIGLDSVLACQLIWRVIWNSIKKFQTFQELYNGKICLLWNLRYGFNNLLVCKIRSFYNLNLCNRLKMTWKRLLMCSGYLQAVHLYKENSCWVCETGEGVSSGPNPVKRLYLI